MNLWRKFRMPGVRKRGTQGSREQMMQAFRVKYSNFKNLLESNAELLKIISDIELKLCGQTVFGPSYIEAQTMRAVFHSARMVMCLENMAGRPFPLLHKRLQEIHRQIKMENGERLAEPVEPPDLTVPYAGIGQHSAPFVGAKNANIGEIRNRLQINTPNGFALTTAAFRRFIEANDLDDTIMRLKSKADLIEAETILEVSQEIQRCMRLARVPQEVIDAMGTARRRLDANFGGANPPIKFSMRSSAIGEDSALSFAGQYLTVLNVPPDRMVAAYREIVASLFSAHAISYRLHMAIPFQSAAMAVACQAMIAARASGVMYTRHPVNPLEDCILINAIWGLGPYAVDGVVAPDTYILNKRDPPGLVQARVTEKRARLVAVSEGGVKSEAVPAELRRRPCLTEAQARQLAALGLRLEAHFGMAQDVEWALDEDDRLVILQSRPLRMDVLETGDRRQWTAPIPGHPVLLEGGEVACVGVGYGTACHVRTENDVANFPDGGVLISPQASARLVMAMPKASAIVADVGNITGHMASLAREYMIPTILNLPQATRAIPPGSEITIDAYNGRVYAGRVSDLIESGVRLNPVVRNSPAYQALRRRADLIVPMNLIDPKSARFAPEYCRTIHDIMRFIHEKSYEEIFQLGDLVTDRGSLSVRLKAHIPIDLYIIDLGGGLRVDATQVSSVTVAQISSDPLLALLDGMLNEKLHSHGPRPIQLGGLVSVMSRQWFSPPNLGGERFGDRSYAIVSDRYLNFSSRVGYHYSILDCYCGRTPAKNHINFQFKGGAADPVRRNRRARVIEKVLADSGFSVDTVADRVGARLAKQPASIIKERLDLLGRLLIYTRQMDMLMHNELLVDKLAECFLNGNYTLEPGVDRSACESGQEL